MAFEWDIRNGKLIYTCNCGWIDVGHANGQAARQLWKDLLNEKDKYRQNGIEGFKVSFSEATLVAKIALNRFGGSYFIKPNLSNIEKQQIALSIFQEVSLGFEKQQLSSGIKGFFVENFGPASGFSEEDLVSNIVGFYDAIKGSNWRNLCKPVTKMETSLKIWYRDGPVGHNKNYTFLPNFHKCDECPDTPQFPFDYQTIKPIEKGILHFDFDEVFAVESFNNVWTPYPLDALDNRLGFHDKIFDFSSSRGNFGLGFVDVPKEVKLIVKRGESQYFFARRALMVAAFNAGLNYGEQLDFVEKFYPLNNKLENISNFKLHWEWGDPSKDNDKKVKEKEFSDLYDTPHTYVLSPDEISELKKMRANKFSFGVKKLR